MVPPLDENWLVVRDIAWGQASPFIWRQFRGRNSSPALSADNGPSSWAGRLAGGLGGWGGKSEWHITASVSCLHPRALYFYKFGSSSKSFLRFSLVSFSCKSFFRFYLVSFSWESFKKISKTNCIPPATASLLGEAHWLKPPTLAGTIVIICMSCFMTGGPGKEHGTNNPPPTRRVLERSKGDTTCLTTSQNPSHWHPSWLIDVCATRKDSESEWLAKDNRETNPITIKLETESHVAEQSSWLPLCYCSLPGCSFPNKISCFVSICVSLDNSFPSVSQEPTFGPWKGSPFLQQL